MRIITKRERIKGVLESWRKQYFGTKYEGKKEIEDELAKLNLLRVNEKVIAKIIGNNTWTSLECGECKENVQIIVRFMEKYENELEANSCDLCIDCLKKATKIVKQKKVGK